MKIIADFLAGSSPFVYLFIFFGKLIEVALASLRSQLLNKGQKLPGAIISIFEFTFWICITASALTGFADDPIKILILIVAFAVGQYMGSVLEEKMALGYCSINAIYMTKELAQEAAVKVREQGHALTLIPAEGMDGEARYALVTTIKRKNLKQVRAILFSVDKKVVVMVQAIQNVAGATIIKKKCK